MAKKEKKKSVSTGCQKRKILFGGLFDARSALCPTVAQSHLSVNPLVSGSMGMAGAESRAIGISLCLTAIISFALTTHLLFTFTPEIEEADWAFTEALAGVRDDGHGN